MVTACLRTIRSSLRSTQPSTSYWSVIVTLVPPCTVSEILQDFALMSPLLFHHNFAGVPGAPDRPCWGRPEHKYWANYPCNYFRSIPPCDNFIRVYPILPILGRNISWGIRNKHNVHNPPHIAFYATVSRPSDHPSVRLSVCLSVCDVQVPVCFSHRLEYFENNFTAQ